VSVESERGECVESAWRVRGECVESVERVGGESGWREWVESVERVGGECGEPCPLYAYRPSSYPLFLPPPLPPLVVALCSLPPTCDLGNDEALFPILYVCL
jgi:hypothetical protein